jgi:DNA-binding response OmpR family regulator
MDLAAGAERLQVLIVEDDPAIRRALSRTLLRAGHEVVAVARCGGARGLGRAFDVAVLDLELPDGTGVDMAGELLGLGATRGVVFFSGAADPSLLIRAAQLGQVVPKGADLGSLLQAISAARGGSVVARHSSQLSPRLARS